MALRGADLDLGRVLLNGRNLDARVQGAVTDGTLRRTILGASTVELTVMDPHRELIRSDLFNRRTTVLIDDMAFEFVAYRKTGSALALTFEDAAWADLGRKRGPKVAAPMTTTRTGFARQLVREVPWLEFRGEKGDPNYKRLARGKKESSRKCLRRMAEDVQWRCFAAEGTVYFGSDEWLLGLGKPFSISEDDDGIDSIDVEYDGGKRATRATVVCNLTRWGARPGVPVEIKRLGELAGKGLWLAESLERSVFSVKGTATLVRKTPALPEPRPEERDHDERAGEGSGRGRAPGVVSTAGWQWPVQGIITGRFGDARYVDGRFSHYHEGLDIATALGTPVRAAKSGHVAFAGYAGGYGNMVEIEHGGGVRSRYAHFSLIRCRTGQRVGYDTIVGEVGSTGTSTGNHLHFEVRAGGAAKDPLGYLP